MTKCNPNCPGDHTCPDNDWCMCGDLVKYHGLGSGHSPVSIHDYVSNQIEEEKKMKVDLIEYTGKGSSDERWRAADVMIFTKHTRVEMDPEKLAEIAAWPVEKKMEELTYMANTIPSSWEFCDYTFMIRRVTRALTHQLVRARTISFAQQTMQILDMSQGDGWTYDEGATITQNRGRSVVYRETMKKIADAYKTLIGDGAKVEDARGVLPTNIHTNIVMKCNLRSLVELVHKRESPRNLGEISRLMVALREAVLEVHPWAHLFFDRTFDHASRDLDRKIMELDLSIEGKRDLCKLVDQMRARS